MALKEQRQQLENLTRAEQCLRANMHAHGVDDNARAHMERAVAHIREAYVAISEAERARTVQELVAELVKVECLVEKLHRKSAPVAAKSIHA